MVDRVKVIEAEDLAEEPFNAADPQQVNTARKKGARKRADRLRVVAALMEHEDGRAWLYDLLAMCHIYSSPLRESDPYGTHFNIGEQNIGRKILADVVAAAPELYVMMCTENSRSR